MKARARHGRGWALAAGIGALSLILGCPENGGNDNDNDNTGNDNAVGSVSGILVTTPEQTPENFDLFTADGEGPLSLANDMNGLVEVDPGTYQLTAHLNEAFVFADEVEVVAGQVTTVRLGGIRVATVPYSTGGTYDIHANGDDTLLQPDNGPYVIVAAPPGVFRLHEHSRHVDNVLVYAEDVAVVAGEVTTVRLGGFNLVTARPARYELFDHYDLLSGDGLIVLASFNDGNSVRPLPAGDYRVKVEHTPMAYDVTITAGELLTYPLGTLLYDGPEDIYSYTVWDASGTNPIVSWTRDELIHLPPGDYVLKDSTGTFIANVTLVAGELTALR